MEEELTYLLNQYEDTQLNKIESLLSKVEMTEDLFHTAISTRSVDLIRLILKYVPVQSISPEQLEFFTHYGNTEKERTHAYELAKILLEYGYVFSNDETSYWFNTIIKDNTTYCDNHIFYNYGH